MSCVIGEAISSFLSLVSVTFSTEYVVYFELKIGNTFSWIYTFYLSYLVLLQFSYCNKRLFRIDKGYNIYSVFLFVHAILENIFYSSYLTQIKVISIREKHTYIHIQLLKVLLYRKANL